MRNLAEPIYLPVSNNVVNSTKTLAVFLEDYKNNFVQIVEEDSIVSTDTFILVEGEGLPEQAATMRQELSDTIPDRYVKRYSRIIKYDKAQKITAAYEDQGNTCTWQPSTTANKQTNANSKSTNRTPTRRLRPSGGGIMANRIIDAGNIHVDNVNKDLIRKEFGQYFEVVNNEVVETNKNNAILTINEGPGARYHSYPTSI